MCVSPAALAIAQVGAQAAQEIIGFVGEGQAAKAGRQSAASDFGQQYNASIGEATEIELGRSDEAFTAAIEAARTSGAIATGAAEGGLSAISAQMVAQGFAADRGQTLTVGNQQRDRQLLQVGREITASESRRDSRIAGNRAPGPLNLLIGLASAGLLGYNTYKGAKDASETGGDV